MKTKPAVAMWLSVAGLLCSANQLYAADPGASTKELIEKGDPKSVNPPKAAEPIKPGTADKPPQVVAPGTADAPPKPVAPGTLDRNVINPDVQIRKGEKPVPK